MPLPAAAITKVAVEPNAAVFPSPGMIELFPPEEPPKVLFATNMVESVKGALLKVAVEVGVAVEEPVLVAVESGGVGVRFTP